MEIAIETKTKKLKLTPQEARELFNELKQMFGEPERIEWVPPVTIPYPYPLPYPPTLPGQPYYGPITITSSGTTQPDALHAPARNEEKWEWSGTNGRYE